MILPRRPPCRNALERGAGELARPSPGADFSEAASAAALDDPEGSNFERDARTHLLALDAETTARLLHEAPAAFPVAKALLNDQVNPEGMTLWLHLNKEDAGLPLTKTLEAQTEQWARQVASALAHMHARMLVRATHIHPR